MQIGLGTVQYVNVFKRVIEIKSPEVTNTSLGSLRSGAALKALVFVPVCQYDLMLTNKHKKCLFTRYCVPCQNRKFTTMSNIES